MESLMSPTITARAQITIPPLDFPKIERTKPIIAIGMPNQFSQPNRGINPITIMIRERTPKRRPIVFML